MPGMMKHKIIEILLLRKFPNEITLRQSVCFLHHILESTNQSVSQSHSFWSISCMIQAFPMWLQKPIDTTHAQPIHKYIRKWILLLSFCTFFVFGLCFGVCHEVLIEWKLMTMLQNEKHINSRKISAFMDTNRMLQKFIEFSYLCKHTIVHII